VEVAVVAEVGLAVSLKEDKTKERHAVKKIRNKRRKHTQGLIMRGASVIVLRAVYCFVNRALNLNQPNPINPPINRTLPP
jgi:hypothetical protein